MRLYLSFIAFAGLVSIQADQADACGLKLSKKAVKISEPIRPSTNPGRILLAGGAPRSLSKVLGQAGHVVASSESLDDVRDQQFDVVLVDDASLGNEARKLWPSADVLPISDRARANLVAVEKVRRREGASGGPTLIAKKEDRDPIKTGPTDVGEKDRTVVAAGPDEKEKREEAAKVEETPAKEEIVEEPVAKAEPVAAKEDPAPIARKEERKAEPIAKSEPKAEPIAKREPKAEPAVRKEEAKPVLAVRTEVIEDEEEKPVKPERAKREDAPVARPDNNEVSFFAASARVVGEHRRTLDAFAKWLKANKSVTIKIEGHASTDGAIDFNQQISERRARAVMQHLLKRGVSSKRMESAGYGEDRPKYQPSESPENRRVEIVVNE